MYYNGTGVERDYRKAYELMTGHDTPASFMKPYYLGLMYKNGDYVEKNTELAIEHFKEIINSDCVMKEYDDYYLLAQKELEEIAAR